MAPEPDPADVPQKAEPDVADLTFGIVNDAQRPDVARTASVPNAASGPIAILLFPYRRFVCPLLLVLVLVALAVSIAA